MIDPTAITSIDPPPGGEHLNIMISACGTKVWVCIDGTAVFRYRNLKKITLEDHRIRDPITEYYLDRAHGGHSAMAPNGPAKR